MSRQERIQLCAGAVDRVKKLVYDVVYHTRSHHIGSILSCLDIVTVLYFGVMKVDPSDPDDESRDRFILSKGHAGLVHYAVLAARGYFSESILDRFGGNGSLFGTHPDKGCLPGIEISSGSLGHGLSIGAGAAYVAKCEGSPSRFWVVMSDGECNEGSVWEAIMFAGHHRLNQLIAIVDLNRFQAFGPTADVLNLDELEKKFESFGWSVLVTDGHSIEALLSAFDEAAVSSERPVAIIARTVKGNGIPSIQNTLQSHYAVLDDALYQEAIDAI